MACPAPLLRRLYEQQYETMIKIAYRMLGSMESAQDVVQDTFLLALFSRSDLAAHPNPEGWLMITLKNLAQNERRKYLRQGNLSLDILTQMPGAEPDTPLALLLPKQLSREDRTVLLWRFERKMDYQEMANRLGISESGCRSRVARAIAHCKKWLETS